MTAPARVSVIIPAFDAEATIQAQLAAIASQRDAPPFEVLVCDNGSLDGTRAIVSAWQDRIENLRLVDASARRGPSAARNIGAAAAVGEVLLFCDADDVVDGRWVAELVTALGDADAVAGAGEYAELNTHFADRGGRTPPFYALAALPHLPAALAGNSGVRAEAFASIGGFDEALRVGEDADLFWRLQLAGKTLVDAPDAVVHIRDRTSLRGVWRQEYGWGAAERQLAHRYELVRRAFEEVAAPPRVPGDPDFDRTTPVAAVRAIARLRRPHDLAYAVRRLGRKAGRRWGRVDASCGRIAPPAQLPTAWAGPAD